MGVGGTTGDSEGGGAIGWDHALKGSDADAHCCYGIGHRHTNFHFSHFKSIPSLPSVPSLSVL